MYKARKRSRIRISSSTLWTIGVVVLITGVVAFMIWLQTLHHPGG